LSTGGTTKGKVLQQLNRWINGPKSPGLIILEHELSEQAVQCFIEAYPGMGSAGWNTTSVARLVPGYDGDIGPAYWNAPNGNSNSSIFQADILSGASVSQAMASSIMSRSMSMSSSGLATGQVAQATGVRAQVSGACPPARLFTSWEFFLAAVVTVGVIRLRV
jgi:hypothetical protein